MIKRIKEFLEFKILQYVINHNTTFQYMVNYITEIQTLEEIERLEKEYKKIVNSYKNL